MKVLKCIFTLGYLKAQFEFLILVTLPNMKYYQTFIEDTSDK